MTALNTGNMILRQSTLDAPELGVLNCTQGVDIAVRGSLVCRAASLFDQDDMEAGDEVFHAYGQSTTLPAGSNNVSATPPKIIQVRESPQLVVDVVAASCTKPRRMRELLFWGASTLIVFCFHMAALCCRLTVPSRGSWEHLQMYMGVPPEVQVPIGLLAPKPRVQHVAPSTTQTASRLRHCHLLLLHFVIPCTVRSWQCHVSREAHQHGQHTACQHQRSWRRQRLLLRPAVAWCHCDVHDDKVRGGL